MVRALKRRGSELGALGYQRSVGRWSTYIATLVTSELWTVARHVRGGGHVSHLTACTRWLAVGSGAGARCPPARELRWGACARVKVEPQCSAAASDATAAAPAPHPPTPEIVVAAPTARADDPMGATAAALSQQYRKWDGFAEDGDDELANLDEDDSGGDGANFEGVDLDALTGPKDHDCAGHGRQPLAHTHACTHACMHVFKRCTCRLANLHTRVLTDLQSYMHIGGHAMHRVALALRAAGARHEASPHAHRAIVMGDFNFEARGNGSHGPRTRADRIMDSELQSWTELAVSGATHITPDSARFQCDRSGVGLLPRSLLAIARPHVSVRARPERVHHLGLSDHAPVEVSWPSAFRMPAARRGSRGRHDARGVGDDVQGSTP